MNDLTALILTYNERENLARTLDALAWVPHILIVDSFSTDGTLEIARARPNVRVAQRAFASFADQCNYGLEQAGTTWVLSLDADYVLTPELSREIQRLEPPDSAAGYRAAFQYAVWGHGLRSTLYPPRTVLYRRAAARYRDDGHGHRVDVAGAVLPLRGIIIHDDRKPLSRWLRSQDRYMVIEARHLLAADPAALTRQDRLRLGSYFAPAVMLLYLLFARGLVLDGWPGWYYVFQRTLAETLLALRLLVERKQMEPPAEPPASAP